ncbi:nucleoside-diphosphate sugar epimerase/dehydratase [Paenibacillus paeoniae]|uniref:Uncharacterized protein n=1 Tax=Paenibacillus paeoniae TaxID=2292705 RepID=A0A371P0V2_9BACL|nr:hypothetical protein [Paenibacillus paeoniae]REK69572.1 hypothetical protein DX130_24025 [Paenibacillus paeoniae]
MTSALHTNIKSGKSPFEKRFITIEELAKRLIPSDAPLIIYGAGATCSDTLKSLFAEKILPLCITDSDPTKAGTSIMDIPVLTPEEAIQKAGPHAICVVAIWSIATFYKDFVTRLSTIGYRQIFFLNIDFRPRSLPKRWVEDVQQNEARLLMTLDKFSDDKSKARFEDFIYSFLSSKLDHCNILGSYKSLDGEILNNDLVQAGNEDSLIHCRSGFQDDKDTYLNKISQLKEAYLFEPTWVGRIKTKEYFHSTQSYKILIFPNLLSNDMTETDFDEKIFFTRFMDQEEYKPAHANTIPLDMLVDELLPTIIHLDMTSGHIEALRGASKMIANNNPTILLSGFRHASEISDIIQTFPLYEFHMRYFGGITMREGYTLVMKSRGLE